MVILTRFNVGGVNNFAAGPLYGFTILFTLHQKFADVDPSLMFGCVTAATTAATLQLLKGESFVKIDPF